MRSVVFHPDALAEWVRARDWYGKRRVGLAAAFSAAIESAVLTIQENPEIGANYIAGTKRFFVHRFPFGLIYRHDQSVIHVLAVMHLRRRPGYWKART